jgi:hypothetical protein
MLWALNVSAENRKSSEGGGERETLKSAARGAVRHST